MKNDNTRQPGHAAGTATPVHIMGFVDGDVIPPSWYDKPYCLAPGKDDDEAYDILRDTMQRTRKVGLASVVIEKKQALAAVIPIGRTLVLNVLRLASGLVPGREAKAAAVRGARQAPQALAAPAPRAETKPARKDGEVIDLAVRRTAKRAHAVRAGKISRARSAGVATLHEIKKAAPRPAARQLA